MADDIQNDDQDQDTGTDAEPTLEQLRAENARLSKANESLDRDVKKYRETEKTRKANEAAEAERRKQAGLSEPEKIAERLRQSEAEKEQAEQRATAAEQARINDANERAILIAAPKHLNADHIDLAWDKIDRTLLTFDDNGKVTGGIDKALKKLAEDRPSWGIAKPKDRGTGPTRNGGNGSEQTGNFFLDSRKNVTVNPL